MEKKNLLITEFLTEMHEGVFKELNQDLLIPEKKSAIDKIFEGEGLEEVIETHPWIISHIIFLGFQDLRDALIKANLTQTQLSTVLNALKRS